MVFIQVNSRWSWVCQVNTRSFWVCQVLPWFSFSTCSASVHSLVTQQNFSHRLCHRLTIYWRPQCLIPSTFNFGMKVQRWHTDELFGWVRSCSIFLAASSILLSCSSSSSFTYKDTTNELHDCTQQHAPMTSASTFC